MGDRLLRCPKTPTDAELEAERDRKHAEEVRRWFDGIDSCVACDHPRHRHCPDTGRCRWNYPLKVGAVYCDCAAYTGGGDE